MVKLILTGRGVTPPSDQLATRVNNTFSDAVHGGYPTLHPPVGPRGPGGGAPKRMLEHKEAIIAHLSWASLFLGFHTLGFYVHNDVMLAFGTPEKQILIEPIFAQWIQSAHGGKTLYGFDVLLSSAGSPASNAGRGL